MSPSRVWTFQLGDHALAAKRGHCAACSQVQALVSVRASTLEAALELVNEALTRPSGGGGVTFAVTYRGAVTKRMLAEGNQ